MAPEGRFTSLLLRNGGGKRAAVDREVGLREGGFFVLCAEELAVDGNNLPCPIDVEQER